VAVRARSRAGRTPRTGVGRLEAMPLRRKLDILVAVPLAVILVLLAPLSYNEFEAAHQWGAAALAMTQAEQVNMLINDLEIEQTVAVGLQGSSALAGHPNLDSVQELKRYGAATDLELTALRKALNPSPTSDLGQALAEVQWQTQGVSGARAIAEDPAPDKSAAVETDYGTAIVELTNALDMDHIAAVGGAAAFDEAELDFLYSGDQSEHNREIDLLAMANSADVDALSGGPATLDWLDLSAVEQDYGLAKNDQLRFGEVAAAADENKYHNATTTLALAYVDAVQDDVEWQMQTSSTDKAVGVDQALAADQISVADIDGSSSNLGLVQASVISEQDLSKAEAQVASDVILAAQQQASHDRWYAAFLVVGAVLVLLLLFLLEIRVRRSVVRPMLRLTDAATQIAEVTRADLDQVADDDEGVDPQAVPNFETVPVYTRDEIGDLAEAFNRVQDTAVRVLERQMAVRRNTAEMFGNVGRRIHNLTGRQLSLIDSAEREETEPSVLERLYRIDHLAVRLQRGADSLMLLSGETEPAFADAPLRLTDVVRSAVGRVEGYQRVVLSAEGDVTVTPAAVGDLTLIVAELVENAVSFSPATSSVDISVRPTAAGASVEIVDHGVGMTNARLAEENARLVRRERLDLAPTKVLGLFVVGRLARRSGISVRLTATPGGGVTVRLDILTSLLFDSPEPPARRRGPAHASRSVPPGAPAPALPVQRATPETGPGLPAAPPAQPTAPGELPVRRRSANPITSNGQPGQAAETGAATNGSAVHGSATNGSAANGSATNGSAVNGAAHAPDVPSAGLARRIRAAVDAAEGAEASSPLAGPPTLPSRRAAAPAAGTQDGPAPVALPRRSRAAVREPAPTQPTAGLAAAHQLDAEAARAAVEEFEAGVEEALRASAQDLPTLRASDEPEGSRP